MTTPVAPDLDRIRVALTFLFVPGDRPERFAKAAASGADVVIIDLEDAVTPGAHALALTNALDALTAGRVRALVRIHSAESDQYGSQLRALAGLHGSGLLGVVLAKSESRRSVETARSVLPATLAVIPLIESAAGVASAPELAGVPGVTRLAFGAVDFSLDVGAEPGSDLLSSVRSMLVISSRAARLAPPVESPSLEIRDLATVTASARRARGFGFGGMLAIHPAQLSAIRDGFAPSLQDVEWATAVIAAEGGAAQVRGQLVDRPVTERARAILSRVSKP